MDRGGVATLRRGTFTEGRLQGGYQTTLRRGCSRGTGRFGHAVRGLKPTTPTGLSVPDRELDTLLQVGDLDVLTREPTAPERYQFVHYLYGSHRPHRPGSHVDDHKSVSPTGSGRNGTPLGCRRLPVVRDTSFVDRVWSGGDSRGTDRPDRRGRTSLFHLRRTGVHTRFRL